MPKQTLLAQGLNTSGRGAAYEVAGQIMSGVRLSDIKALSKLERKAQLIDSDDLTLRVSVAGVCLLTQKLVSERIYAFSFALAAWRYPRLVSPRATNTLRLRSSSCGLPQGWPQRLLDCKNVGMLCEFMIATDRLRACSGLPP
jgi:hypothetical protein